MSLKCKLFTQVLHPIALLTFEFFGYEDLLVEDLKLKRPIRSFRANSNSLRLVNSMASARYRFHYLRRSFRVAARSPFACHYACGHPLRRASLLPSSDSGRSSTSLQSFAGRCRTVHRSAIAVYWTRIVGRCGIITTIVDLQPLTL